MPMVSKKDYDLLQVCKARIAANNAAAKAWVEKREAEKEAKKQAAENLAKIGT